MHPEGMTAKVIKSNATLRHMRPPPTRDCKRRLHGSQQTAYDVQVLATTDEKPSIVYAELDYAELEKRRTNMPLMQQKRYDLYSLVDKTL